MTTPSQTAMHPNLQLTDITVRLPDESGQRTLTLHEPAILSTSHGSPSCRRVYSAAHVVADPFRSSAGSPTIIDWDQTLGIRHKLWDLGLGIAESMDTAQRGMGLDAEQAMDLAQRTLKEARQRDDAQVVVGINTDALKPGQHSLQIIIDAYLEQLEQIESAGGTVVMMASRHLAVSARSAADYLHVYDAVLSQAHRPVVIHWLGDMFDPSLAGYWGSHDVHEAAETVLEIVTGQSARVDGIKLSLLDEDFEIALRRRLPEGVRMFTGDDFNYASLIAGDEQGHSDALLGAFAAVPSFSSAAFRKLDAGDVEGFREILDPTIALSRLIFQKPTQYYKVGVAWLSYLNGWQSNFRMVAGFESGRSALHLAQVLEQADQIGLFEDPQLAATRATAYFRGLGL